MSRPLLEVRGLKTWFPQASHRWHRATSWVKAVDGVSFSIPQGRTLGLVGESGCGKTTLGRSILRLIEPNAGEVILDGKPVTGIPPSELRRRRKDMQIVFQDPETSLSPRRTIRQTLIEPLNVHGIDKRRERTARVRQLLDLVGLEASAAERYPHEFSTGQRQRIGIARALSLEPKFIVADEAVSSLDVSIRKQILELLQDLQRRFDIAFLFIAHDLAVVQQVSHDVAVMYLGRIVEQAPAASLYAHPKHPYTRALLAAVPVPDPKRKRRRILLSGEVPSAADPPAGCPFHTRCPEVMPVCKTVVPRELDLGSATQPHLVRCHLHDPDLGPQMTTGSGHPGRSSRDAATNVSEQ